MKNPLKVKIKKCHPDAVIPKYAKPGDAGMDITAVTVSVNEHTGAISYGTGLSIEIPEGYVGLVFPRSSNCKKDLYLTNSVGVIDSGFRGEIKMVYKPDYYHWALATDRDNLNDRIEKEGILMTYETAKDEHRGLAVEGHIYALGDRIAQLIIMAYPSIEFEEVDGLSETERGAGGYGHTGK